MQATGDYRLSGLCARRLRLLSAGLFLCVSAVCSAVARPNIIFILCDDLGYGDVGALWQNTRREANNPAEPWHMTPRLDAFAAQGIQLRHHYCPAPVCAPSRASLLTGVHQGHAQRRDNQFDLALADNHTLGTVLQQAGYATACIGKWGLQGGLDGRPQPQWDAYPTNRGFDFYFGYVRHQDGHYHYPKEDGRQVWENDTEVSGNLDLCYTTDLFTARTKKWIVDHCAAHPEQPFLVYLAYDTPHAILDVATQAYPAGGGLTGGLQWLGTPGAMINTASGSKNGYNHTDYRDLTYDKDNNPATPDVEWEAIWKRYASMVRRIDSCVGDLTDLLADLGIDENTLVVFTSDNGPSKEDYLGWATSYSPAFFNSFGPFDGIKRDCWEGGIRVGALARWPGHIPAGRVSTTASGFWDWMPTFADLAGVPPPARTDGVSLVPDLTGQAGQRESSIYLEYYNNSSTPGYGEFEASRQGASRKQMQAIRLGDLMGVRYNIQSHADDFQIYDVMHDPKQVFNLAGRPEYRAIQQKMKDTVLRMRRPDGNAPRPYDDELVPALTVSPVTAGVVWRAYEGMFPWVPETCVRVPDAAGIADGLDLGVLPREENVAVEFSGYIQCPLAGDYTFTLNADSGAALRLHKALVVDADFGYSGGSDRSGSIKLEAGLHAFRILYARQTGGLPALTFEWAGPGIARQAVPASVLYRDGTGTPATPVAVSDRASTVRGQPIAIDVLTNDSDDGSPRPLIVATATPSQSGSVSNRAVDLVYTPSPGFLGEDRFTYVVTDGIGFSTAAVSVSVCCQSPTNLWLTFDELSGGDVYDVGGRPIGSMTNFANVAAARVNGKFNRAIEFDGADDHIILGHGFVPPSYASDRTTAAWIKTTGVGAIVAWGKNRDYNKWYMRLENATGTGVPTGALRVETGGGSIRGTTDLRDGRWHHVAATFANDGTPDVEDVVLYVDGVAEAIDESRAKRIFTDVAPVLIGKDNQARHFPGLIDDVRIYHRSLSAGEVAALANASHGSADAWHTRHFGDAPIRWDADDDLDLLDRLTEYAFGTSPHLADSDPPGLHITGNRYGSLHVLVRLRRTGTHELAYRLQTSTDLKVWSPHGTVPVLSPLDAAWDSASYPVALTNALEYLRLRGALPR